MYILRPKSVNLQKLSIKTWWWVSCRRAHSYLTFFGYIFWRSEILATCQEKSIFLFCLQDRLKVHSMNVHYCTVVYNTRPTFAGLIFPWKHVLGFGAPLSADLYFFFNQILNGKVIICVRIIQMKVFGICTTNAKLFVISFEFETFYHVIQGDGY